MTELHKWVDPEKGVLARTIKQMTTEDGRYVTETVVETEPIADYRGRLPGWAETLIPETDD